jgi:hypothetical protein
MMSISVSYLRIGSLPRHLPKSTRNGRTASLKSSIQQKILKTEFLREVFGFYEKVCVYSKYRMLIVRYAYLLMLFMGELLFFF